MAKAAVKAVKHETTKGAEYATEYGEIVRQLRTATAPLPDGSSLAQPSPFRAVPTVVTYGAYDQPLVG